MDVSDRFNSLLKNLNITDDQKNDGITKHSGVRKCLNNHYYGWSSDTANSFLIGAWGKSTRIRPPRDIDILFELPANVYERFQGRMGNKQSQLLQEMRSVLADRYQVTDVKGDGPVVVVPFSTWKVEVVPGIKLQNGQYWIPRTERGGYYKTFDPKAEIQSLKDSNDSSNNNTRDLIRMMKAWQDTCNVPIRSFWLELLAADFIRTWEHRGKSALYYDWMVRDFFYYLTQRARFNVYAPGTHEAMAIGDDWLSRANSAYARASNAVAYEARKASLDAGDEWQKIFGYSIPGD